LEKSIVIEFVNNMKPNDHVILIYANTEDKYYVLFTYLKAGLDKGEAAAYVAGQETPEQIRKAMQKFGIDVKRCEQSGALTVIDYRDWYIIGGKVDIRKTMRLWGSMFDETKKKGLRGFRVAGEMACFLDNGLVKELLEYERTLHRTLELSMMAICAYDQNAIARTQGYDATRLLLDLLKAHSTAIIMGPEGGLVKTVAQR
jgi:hypothetical protein